MSDRPRIEIDGLASSISEARNPAWTVGRLKLIWFAGVGVLFSLVFLSPVHSLCFQEQEKVSPETPVTTSESGSTTDSAPSTGQPVSNRIYELTFDDLAFEMEKGSTFNRDMLTPKINEYDGATIKLRGFIRPSFTPKGLTKFVFVRDNQECCFGPGAALYDCVLVKLAEGNKTDFTVRPVTVEGEFYLKEYQGPDGKIWSIYRLKEGVVR